MKTSSTQFAVLRKKKKLSHTASNIGASFAAVAVVCSAFNPHLAEIVALGGVVADVGVRLLLRIV